MVDDTAPDAAHQPQHASGPGVPRRRIGVALCLAGLALVLLAACIMAWIWRERAVGIGAWQPLWTRDFTAAGADPSCLRTQDMTGRFAGLEAQGQDGVLLHEKNLFWLDGITDRGDVRLTAEVVWPHVVDGLVMHVNARRDQAIDKVDLVPGFGCHVGAYLGTRTFISVTWPKERHLPFRFASPELVPGRPYQVTLTHAGGRVSVAIDGAVILDQEVVLPPRGPEFSGFALRPWSDVLLRRLTIERLGLPERPSPLLAGDTLLAGDNPEQAVSVFEQVAADHPGSALAEDALARAVLAACKSRTVDAWEAPLARLEQSFPASRMLQPCLEAEAATRWARGDLEAAVGLAEAVLRRFPDSHIAVSLLHRRPEQMPRPVLDALLALVGRTRDVEHLDLSLLPITDLGFLRGMRLRHLNIQRTAVSDLAPLAGMPLVDLVARYTPLRDLAPLAGMPLHILHLDDTRVDDLGVLAGMPLRRFSLTSAPLASAASLRGVAPLEMTLADLPIDVLPDIDYARMSMLDIRKTAISDIARLRSARGLVSVNLEYTAVADISPLREAPLQRLNISRTRVSDLAPLAGARLRFLDADDSPLADVRPLAGMPLRNLRLGNTPVRDIAMLDFSAIDWLFLNGSQVTDLSPLRGSPLRGLSIAKTAIADFEPILAMPQLQELSFSPAKDQERFWGALVAKLQSEGRRDLARSIGERLAWVSEDPARMRALAQRHGGRLRFDCHVYVDIASARAAARRLGARLPCLDGPEDEARLIALLGPNWYRCWLGLSGDVDGRPVWDDGSRMAWGRITDTAAVPAGASWFIGFNQQGIVWNRVGGGDLCNLVLEWDEAPGRP